MSKPTRKQYKTPKVKAYGNVRQITQAKSSGSKDDNSGKSNHKTGISNNDD